MHVALLAFLAHSQFSADGSVAPSVFHFEGEPTVRAALV